MAEYLTQVFQFPFRTARSQRPYVFIQPLDGIRIDVIRYELETFQILFPTASLIFTTAKLFYQVRKNEA